MNRLAFCCMAAAILIARELTACDCAPPPPPREALQRSAAVFLAKVTQVDDDPALPAVRRVTLSVEKWWKGGDTKTVTIRTGRSGAICGYGFRDGGRYLVFAYIEQDSKHLYVSLCSRTCPFEAADASGEFKELGAAKTP